MKDKRAVVEENGKLMHSLIKEVVSKTGPRLPGSPEEKEGAATVAEIMRRETSLEPVTEKFTMAPRASIGAIPGLGIAGLAAFALFYLSPIACLIVSAACFIFAMLQVFTYSGALDFLFKKEESQNVYATLPPKGGKTDYTVMFSGHVDSSWNWNLSLKNPKTMIVKTILGVVSVAVLAVISIIAICEGALAFTFLNTLAVKTQLTNKDIFCIVLYVLPLLCVPGCYWLATFLSYDKTKAAPGAMDNMSGVSLAIAAVKYYKEHPEDAPEGCRFICAGLGCEEAGLKGSQAFVAAHKDDKDLFNENLYVINLDSFRDDEYFNVVKGDLWLFSHFDQGLMDASREAMSEAGLKPGTIVNPVGGCDSTSFFRAGIKTVTLNAQNPTATNYYHTKYDTVEGLSMYSLEKAFETVVNLVPRISALHNGAASAPADKAEPVTTANKTHAA